MRRTTAKGNKKISNSEKLAFKKLGIDHKDLKKRKRNEHFFRIITLNSRSLRGGNEILADYNVQILRTGPVNSLEKILNTLVKQMEKYMIILEYKFT